MGLGASFDEVTNRGNPAPLRNKILALSDTALPANTNRTKKNLKLSTFLINTVAGLRESS